MVSKFKSLAVVIPVHNEERIIKKTVSKVLSELNKLSVNSLLLIINDGSTDKTQDLLHELSRKYSKLKILKHNKNKGYGGAIQTGISYCLLKKIDYALFMDSDLTNDPKEIKKFVSEINNNYDCVKASRYISGGKTIKVPAGKIVISRFGNLISSLLFNVGIKDCTNGFRMLKVSKLKYIKLQENGFPVIMEEMYYLKKKKAKFKEIPITLRNRQHGKSHFRYSFRTFYDYLKYPIKSLWL